MCATTATRSDFTNTLTPILNALNNDKTPNSQPQQPSHNGKNA
jgi:hypothetical protein